MIRGCILSFLSLFSALGVSARDVDKTTISSLDISRYMGTWYEVARMDHRFERGKVGVKAVYELQDDGTIAVINSGYHDSLDGEFTEASAVAYQPDASVPGKLKVAFFWKVYTPYYIMELGDDYEYALIGSSGDNFLWILSRTPQIDEASLSSLLLRASERGYDISELIFVEQPVLMSDSVKK